MSRNWKPWTEADLAALRETYPDTSTAALAQQFKRSAATISHKAAALGIRKSAAFLASPASGRMTTGTQRGAGSRFRPGHRTWNTGKRYKAGGRSAETRFPKGHKPHNWVPVGTYRVNPEGYLDRKVSDAKPAYRNWVAVHRLVWTKAHGPIPPGHVVTFRPGRHSTKLEEITPDALELITQRESMLRNSVHNLPREIVDVIYVRSGLVRRINDAEKKRAKQDQRPA
jgi:hypothetical protein